MAQLFDAHRVMLVKSGGSAYLANLCWEIDGRVCASGAVKLLEELLEAKSTLMVGWVGNILLQWELLGQNRPA